MSNGLNDLKDTEKKGACMHFCFVKLLKMNDDKNRTSITNVIYCIFRKILLICYVGSQGVC